MSEQQTTGFMEKLDQWTEENIFAPLLSTDEDGQSEELSQEILDQVKHAIRAKILESYKNGCRSGAGHVRKELSHAQAKTL